MSTYEVAAFDVASAAGWYSAIAGLLAGFAMLAILLPLDHKVSVAESDESSASGEVVFASAFFSLLVLSYSYAALSGKPPSLAAAHEQQLNAASFGLASMLLVLGLREILRLYGGNRKMFVPAQSLISLFTGVFGPIMVVAFQFANSFRIETARDLAGLDAGVPLGVRIDVAIAIAAVIIIGLVPLIAGRVHLGSGAVAAIGYATLGFTVFVAVWTAAVTPFLPFSVLASPVVAHGILAVTCLGTVAFATAAWLSRPSDVSHAPIRGSDSARSPSACSALAQAHTLDEEGIPSDSPRRLP